MTINTHYSREKYHKNVKSVKQLRIVPKVSNTCKKNDENRRKRVKSPEHPETWRMPYPGATSHFTPTLPEFNESYPAYYQ